MMRAISDLGINLRGVSAAAIGGKFVTYIGFYRADEASRAAQALRSLEAGKAPSKARKAAKKSKPAKRRR